MKYGYQCDNCKDFTELKIWIFYCIDCEKEICQSCMCGWATCKECAANKDDKFLEERFEQEFNT